MTALGAGADGAIPPGQLEVRSLAIPGTWELEPVPVAVADVADGA